MYRPVSLLASLAVVAAPAFAQEPTAAPPNTQTPETTATTTTKDTAPPQVLDISIAADNPAAAPVLSAQLRDDVGVASAVAHWRAPGGTWQHTPFVGTALAIARLPNGPQKTGFAVWVEVRDAAGNVTRVGSEAAPLDIAAAVEGNVERVAREAADAAAIGGPHPAWVMLALGTGIAATGGAGIAWFDYNAQQEKLVVVDRLLANDLSEARRAELERDRSLIENAAVQDGVVMTVLGVIGGAALTTGAILLTVAAIEQ